MRLGATVLPPVDRIPVSDKTTCLFRLSVNVKLVGGQKKGGQDLLSENV